MAEFLVAPATVSGVIAALSAAIGLEPVALIAAEVGMLSADAIATVARFFADSFLAVSVISVAGVMLAMSALVIFRWPQTTWRIRIVWLVILTFLLTGGTQLIEQRNSFQRIPWRMAICDVGQGDAAVLKSSAGHIVVIDAGPDETAMDDCLDELGVGTVSLFIASHFHADHVGGLRALVQGRSVETVLVSPVLKPSGGAELLQRNLTNKLHFARPGMKGSLADLTWEVLLAPDKISGESGTDINNASVVIKIELASHSILFTGDIEEAAQTQLMQRVPPGQMDVIKVPHHGSRYQHPDLPAWSAAQWGWLSVGRDNDYGHPASETLQQYQAAHIRLYSTSECGNLAWLGESHVVSSRACQVSSSSAMLGP
jgi:competence protein ComEC